MPGNKMRLRLPEGIACAGLRVQRCTCSACMAQVWLLANHVSQRCVRPPIVSTHSVKHIRNQLLGMLCLNRSSQESYVAWLDLTSQ